MVVAAALVALAADLLSASASTTQRTANGGTLAPGELDIFALQPDDDSGTSRGAIAIARDPFGAVSGDEPRDVDAAPVASAGGRSTVSTAPARRRHLSAVLIADDRPVAVIDEQVVAIGDTLRDGARVSAIQVEKVWVVEKNGRWRMLTLTPGSP